ncbi:hypothetical protein FACS189483_01250 [Spirochaetia bacterium]|nr:hypothetical protein FACS189483_01250 [Spirochaetia bacterium]
MGGRGASMENRSRSGSENGGYIPGLLDTGHEKLIQEFQQNVSMTNGEAQNLVGSAIGANILDQKDDTGLKKCVCCGQKTLPQGSVSVICPICGWRDDEFQNNHPDYPSGTNHISLNDAKKAWAAKKIKAAL